MKVIKMYAETFVKQPQWGYASLIFDKEQLKVCHNHDYYEIFVVSEGNACHQVNGAQIKIASGDIFLMRPEDIHYYDSASGGFRIINIIVPINIMNSLFAYLGEGFDKDRLLNSTLPSVSHVGFKELPSLVGELEQLVLSKKILKEKSDSSFRIVLFNIIVRYFSPKLATKTSDIPQWLQWLNLEMLKKENFQAGLPAFYKLSGRSIEHVSRMCKKYLNKSPTRLINDIRLEYAARLLITTDMKIIDICEEIGFDSLSHFYHLFKNTFGISPIKFKKNAVEMSLKDKIPEVFSHEKKIADGMAMPSYAND